MFRTVILGLALAAAPVEVEALYVAPRVFLEDRIFDLCRATAGQDDWRCERLVETPVRWGEA